MSAVPPVKRYQTLIFHVDVNSAFLSWSALKALEENPGSVDLRTIPSAVAGDVETRHGIITAKSIPAKKFGIETAEPVGSALRKCPSLVLVKSDFRTYRMYSRELMGLLREYAPEVEQVSIDEAYLDMSHLWEEMRDGVYGQSVTVSVKTDRFRRRSHQSTLQSSTNDADRIYENAAALARDLLFGSGGPFSGGEKIRLIGVGMSRLDRGEYRQMTLFDMEMQPAGGRREDAGKMTPEEAARRKKLDEMMSGIRRKYGEGAIRKGS